MAIEVLTVREREVLQLMAQGRTNSAIGSWLHLSAKTVEARIRNIFMKLQLEPAEDDHRRVWLCLPLKVTRGVGEAGERRQLFAELPSDVQGLLAQLSRRDD
ncbi:MAG TPA: helix-turn-helix transcriptional regulator [Verrucomicrobiae bacterium]|jgi:hypothetical protein|nr:helix-turn-helix transcriptional regulator [Verrucomicrobiae bacterium]